MSQDRLKNLIDAHGRDVLAYARRRVDSATAEEITAEVFVVAWRRLDRIPETEPVLWLYGVARRLLSNERRSARRREVLSSALASFAPRSSAPVNQEAPVLEALGALRPADREVLLLSAWEGLDAQQTGVVLGCSAAAVHTRLHRARNRLERQMALQASAPSPPPPTSLREVSSND